jgi:hypothetical protein
MSCPPYAVSQFAFHGPKDSESDHLDAPEMRKWSPPNEFWIMADH